MTNIDYTKKMKKLAPIPEDMRIFWVRDDLARIEAKTPYCLQCIKEGREIVAALDDMAQIIGPMVRIVADDDMEIAKALTSSAAVLVDAEQVTGGDILPMSGSSMDGKARRDQDYVITTGRDPYEAFVALTVLEKAAEVAIKSDALGRVKPIPERIAKKLRRDYINKYSKPGRERREKDFLEGTSEKPKEASENPKEGMPKDEGEGGMTPETLVEEFHQRAELVKYGKLLVEKNLVQGTWGNISVRLDDTFILVTPTGIDYDNLGPGDMVLVNIETGEYDKKGNKPTTELPIHIEVYKSRPDLGAIIHTHSKYASIFAACQMPVDVKDTYLSEEIKDDVIYIADYAESGSKELTENVVKALGEVKDFGYGRRGCILSNHGMLACGVELEDTLEVALAMEEASRQLINERLLKLVELRERVKEYASSQLPED